MGIDRRSRHCSLARCCYSLPAEHSVFGVNARNAANGTNGKLRRGLASVDPLTHGRHLDHGAHACVAQEAVQRSEIVRVMAPRWCATLVTHV